jgi:hypothetical protein
MNSTAFINSVKGQAIADMKKFGVLASLTIAQAILESGWGESGLTKKANNLFGIKAGTSWTGDKVVMSTQEFEGGRYITIDAAFRKYPSWADSISDHTKLLTGKRYANLLWSKDYKTVCSLIQADGYATSPTYAQKLIKLIEQYKLYEFDQEISYKPIESNSNVSEFQSLCNAKGRRDENGNPLDVDGDFGGHTAAAAPVIKKGSNEKDFVMLIQKMLKRFGYNLGAYGPNRDGIDGDFGNTTLNAVISFQQARSLSADGIVGKNTWKALLS